jgi:tetratricopeptide (TPR) repeat protein
MEPLLAEAAEILERGSYERALELYQRAAGTDPRSGVAYDGIAQCQYRLRHHDEAQQAADIATALDPNLISPHLILAYIFAQRKDWEHAHREALAALDLAPDQFETLDCYGTVLAGEGDPERAIPYLRRALEIEPSALSTHHNLAVIYGQLGHTRNLIGELRAINKLNPSLSNRIWLASAIHHRYMVYLIVAMLIIIVLAGVWELPQLLLIPALYLGWLGLNVYWEIRNGRWRRGILLLGIMLIYAGTLFWFYQGIIRD